MLAIAGRGHPTRDATVSEQTSYGVRFYGLRVFRQSGCADPSTLADWPCSEEIAPAASVFSIVVGRPVA
jgi:hypothetical protein